MASTRGLLAKVAERFYDEIGVDRNDPKSFINAGPRGQNLEVTSHPDVRATLNDSPLQEMCEELVGHELNGPRKARDNGDGGRLPGSGSRAPR